MQTRLSITMLARVADVPEVKGHFPSVEREGLHQYLLIWGAEP